MQGLLRNQIFVSGLSDFTVFDHVTLLRHFRMMFLKWVFISHVNHFNFAAYTWILCECLSPYFGPSPGSRGPDLILPRYKIVLLKNAVLEFFFLFQCRPYTLTMALPWALISWFKQTSFILFICIQGIVYFNLFWRLSSILRDKIKINNVSDTIQIKQLCHINEKIYNTTGN